MKVDTRWSYIYRYKLTKSQNQREMNCNSQGTKSDPNISNTHQSSNELSRSNQENHPCQKVILTYLIHTNYIKAFRNTEELTKRSLSQDDIYLPEREEDNPLDAQELCKRLVRCQLFSKQVVEKNQGI